MLDQRLAARNESLNLAIMLDVPREQLEDRILNRMVHPPSGRIYHPTFRPPLRLGLDDQTGEPLARRADDNSATFAKRHHLYMTHAKHMEDYYRAAGRLLLVRGLDTPSLYLQIREYFLRSNLMHAAARDKGTLSTPMAVASMQ
jgi:adenylate kinase